MNIYEEDTVWPSLVSSETHLSAQGNCRKCVPQLIKILIKCWEWNEIQMQFLFFKLLLEIPMISYQWPEEVYTLYILDKEVLI